MKYISKLTEEQKALMPIWADKWIKKGLQTGETDWDTFDKYMPICYEKAGLKYPKRVVRVSSPLVGALASSIADSLISKKSSCSVSCALSGAVDVAVSRAVDGVVDVVVDRAVDVVVDGAVDGAVRGAVYVAVSRAVDGVVDVVVDGAVDGDVYGAVYVAVDGAVGGAVDVAVSRAVDGVVYVAVDRAVGGAVDDVVDRAVRKIKLSWHGWLGGQFWVGYYWRGVAYCDFMVEALGLELKKDIEERRIAYKKVCESVNYIWPNCNFVMVCARPSEIHLKNNKLHKDGGMAIKYPDGWGLYCLNGVRVPEYLAVTKDTDLDIEWYKNQKNADVKAEFVRKYGIERMVGLGAVVDSHSNYNNDWYAKSEYQLIDMSSIFESIKYAPYLKMKNQTTGIWHMEGVSPECRTIDQALQFRCGDKIEIQSIK